MTSWAIFKKGDTIAIDKKSDTDRIVKDLLKDRQFTVEEVFWSSCHCECGRKRNFDSFGKCLACDKLCKQFVLVEGREYKSELFSLVKKTET